MEIEDLFKVRDKSYIRLNNLTDYLGRSLRENVVIFDVDSKENEISFLTESEKFITGKYTLKEGSMILEDITVDNADDVMSDEAVDNYLTEQVHSFVSNLREGSYSDATLDYNGMIDVFKSRGRINETRSNLSEKLKSLTESSLTGDSSCFGKLSELKDNIEKFVKDNEKVIKENSDILNSVKLNNSMSRVFDTKKLTYDELIKEGLYVDDNESIELYEMVCRRELIAREIYESRKNFSNMWVSNNLLGELAEGLINEEVSVPDKVSSLIKEVPYFALAAKSEINEALSRVAMIDLGGEVSKKRIKEYTAAIFELKKDAKKEIVKRLNESYGVNINNLRYVPTFSDLATTQATLFETLASMSGSEIITEKLTEAANSIKGHSGIDVLVVSDVINEVLTPALNVIFENAIPELNDSILLEELGAEASNLISEEGYYGDMGDGEDDDEDESKKSKKKAKGKLVKKKKGKDGDDEDGDDEDEDDEGVDDEKGKKKEDKKPKKGKKPLKEGVEEDGDIEEEVELTDEEIAAGEVPDEDGMREGEEEDEEVESNDQVNLSDEDIHKLTDDLGDMMKGMEVSSKKGSVDDEPDLSEDEE